MGRKPAGKKANRKAPTSFKKVYAALEETETGKKIPVCPECGRPPQDACNDYGLTSDEKHYWFSHICKQCELEYYHFSNLQGSAVELSSVYTPTGRNKADAEEQAAQKPRNFPKKGATKSKKPLPRVVQRPAAKRARIIDLD